MTATDGSADTTSAGDSSDGPRGPEQVRAALLEAAGRLFAERGADAVSVREIASAAGVNHGLVHHYFGGKDDLLKEVVLATSASVFADALTGASGVGPSEGAGLWAGRIWGAAEADGRWKVVVRALLDGQVQLLADIERPGLDSVESRIRAGQQLGLIADDVDPAVIIGVGAALLVGSLVLEPLFAELTGSDQDREELARQVGTMWRRALGVDPDLGI